jgi:hypothetical protein
VLDNCANSDYSNASILLVTSSLLTAGRMLKAVTKAWQRRNRESDTYSTLHLNISIANKKLTISLTR